MKSNLQAHPAASMFPMIPQDELEALSADIGANGLLDPVVLFQGKILDGRNRAKACEMAGVRVETVAWRPRNGEGPIAYAIAKNLHRRHLSASQRAALAVEVLPKLEAEARAAKATAGASSAPGRPAEKDGQKVDQVSREPRASDRAAELLGTNRQYVSDAKKISQDAPELLEKVKTGELNIREARAQAKAKVDSDNSQKEELWKDIEIMKRSQLLEGATVVVNLKLEPLLASWAEREGLLVRVDRQSKWGNPFLLGEDGDRDQVCDAYRDHYLPHKPSLLADAHLLQGRALGCWCSPLRCHADCLVDEAQ